LKVTLAPATIVVTAVNVTVSVAPGADTSTSPGIPPGGPVPRTFAVQTLVAFGGVKAALVHVAVPAVTVHVGAVAGCPVPLATHADATQV
jgi:hypothetical protein